MAADKNNKRNPAAPFSDVMAQMDAFFNKSINNFNTLWNARSFEVDMYETKSSVIVEAILPGYKRDQIQLEILGRQLRIAVEDDASFEEKYDNKPFRRVEQSYQKMERLVSLPFPISKKDTTASYQNGVLKVSIPKNNEGRTFIDIH